MASPRPSDFRLELDAPTETLIGWRVTVFAWGAMVAETVENSAYEAAVIGVGLFYRAAAARERQQ